MSPRGGIAEPPWPYYSETGGGCQLLRAGCHHHDAGSPTCTHSPPWAPVSCSPLLWFDLMFDVQTREHSGDVLPPEVLGSISAHYRRVTTEAYPMNRLVGCGDAADTCRHLRRDRARRKSVVDRLGLIAVGGKWFRAYDDARSPNARRLGGGKDTADEQSRLARGVPRSHAELRADGLVGEIT